MVHAARHDPDEPQTLQLGEVRDWSLHRHDRPNLDLCRSKLPAADVVHCGGVGERHAANGIPHRWRAGHDEHHPAVDGLDLGVGVQRDGAHIRQMLPQRLDVDLRPIGMVCQSRIDVPLRAGASCALSRAEIDPPVWSATGFRHFPARAGTCCLMAHSMPGSTSPGGSAGSSASTDAKPASVEAGRPGALRARQPRGEARQFGIVRAQA